MSKVCTDCKIPKSLNCFHKSVRSGRQPVCRLCKRKRDKNRYLFNPRKKELNIRRRRERAAFIADYKKQKGCLYCPENDPCCLDFHHVDEKLEEIANIKHSWSMERLLAEIAKCDVVCSNCHRKLHNISVILEEICPVGVAEARQSSKLKEEVQLFYGVLHK